MLAAKNILVPLGWLTRTYFVALFAGQFLPAAIGGDAVRAIELGRRTDDGPEAVASVLIDRLVGVVSLVVLALVAIAIGDHSGYRPEVIAVEGLFGLAAALILALLFSSRLRGVVARTLEPRAGGHRLAAGQRFYEALHAYRDHRRTLVAVCGLAMIVQIARIGVIWMLVQALDLPVNVGVVLVTGPVVFAALVLPVSLNGIGVREAVFVYFLRDQVSTSEAVALGFAFFAVGTATALVGAVVLGVRFVRYGARGVRRRTEIEPPAEHDRPRQPRAASGYRVTRCRPSSSQGRDFLRSDDLTGEEIVHLLDLADRLKRLVHDRVEHRLLPGRSLAMIFERSSTRTRVSFEVGMQQLGGIAVPLTAADTQIGRGESITDTGLVLARYVDGIVIRTGSHTRVEELAAAAEVPVINALTDVEHPCQALAELQTMRERLGSLAGRRVAWVGDGNNVCRSLMVAAARWGCRSPWPRRIEFQPDAGLVASLGDAVELTTDPRAAVAGADAVVTDVWASMGHEEEREERVAKLGAYQVNAELLEGARRPSTSCCTASRRTSGRRSPTTS